MSGRRAVATAGRRRQSRAKGGFERVEVPVEQVRALWRPNWRSPLASIQPMDEDTPGVGLLAVVIKAIKLRPTLGYLHIGVSIGSTCPGYPDLHVYGDGGMLWWELKGSAGRVYAHQVAEIERIRRAGGEARFIWPEDYLIGVVDDALDRLAADGPGHAETAWARGGRRMEPGRRFCGCPIEGEHEPACPTWGRGRDGIRR